MRTTMLRMALVSLVVACAAPAHAQEKDAVRIPLPGAEHPLAGAEHPPMLCERGDCQESERDARGCCPSETTVALTALRQRTAPRLGRRAAWSPALPIPETSHELPAGPEDARTALRAAIDARRPTALTRFVSEHADTPALNLRARFELARRQQRSPRRWSAALQEIIGVHHTLVGRDAHLVAISRLALADIAAAPTMRTELRLRPAASMHALVADLQSQVQARAVATQSSVSEYDRVLAYRSPAASITALTRQGQLYDALVRSLADLEVPMPRELRRQTAGAPAEVRADLEASVNDQILGVLLAQMAPIECFAISRYMLAFRASQAARGGPVTAELGAVPSFLHDRLQRYGEERIEQCVTQARRSDSTFAPYRRGELDD